MMILLYECCPWEEFVIFSGNLKTKDIGEAKLELKLRPSWHDIKLSLSFFLLDRSHLSGGHCHHTACSLQFAAFKPSLPRVLLSQLHHDGDHLQNQEGARNAGEDANSAATRGKAMWGNSSGWSSRNLIWNEVKIHHFGAKMWCAWWFLWLWKKEKKN